MVHRNQNPRYQRQTSLKEFGEAGQQKLSEAKVLVVGAGGIGCPALQYLTGAGVGTIGIIDSDTVSLNNLHRQVLYSTDDVGLSKADRAADILTSLNPEIEIVAYNEALTTVNAFNIFLGYDIILDGTDNFATRYLINDACVLFDKILVYGAISRFEGQVAVFNVSPDEGKISSNYRDLFPVPPEEGEVLNCAETGVIGVLPGIIGTMMANETIKLIAGIGEPLVNRLMTYNVLTNQFYELEVVPKEETKSLIPAGIEAFQKMNYELRCSIPAANEIDCNTFEQLLNDPAASFVDVREIDENPLVHEFDNLQLPFSKFRSNLEQIRSEKVILFCQTGKRSATAARIIVDHYGNSKKVYSLKGGIVAWKDSRKK